MNEKKIDLILKGINLLVLNSGLHDDFKDSFSGDFWKIYNKEDDTEKRIAKSLTPKEASKN